MLYDISWFLYLPVSEAPDKAGPDGIEEIFSGEGDPVKMGVKDGDVILFSADAPAIVNAALGNLRLHLAKKLNLVAADELAFTRHGVSLSKAARSSK